MLLMSSSRPFILDAYGPKPFFFFKRKTSRELETVRFFLGLVCEIEEENFKKGKKNCSFYSPHKHAFYTHMILEEQCHLHRVLGFFRLLPWCQPCSVIQRNFNMAFTLNFVSFYREFTVNSYIHGFCRDSYFFFFFLFFFWDLKSKKKTKIPVTLEWLISRLYSLFFCFFSKIFKWSLLVAFP